MTRRSPFRVPATLTSAAAALVILSGCMTVHGEREMLPAVSKAEGAKALTRFTDSFNKTYRELDPKRNPSFEAGALLAIDQAGIKASQALRPQGNPDFPALELTEPRFTVPKQAGWPKYFVADAHSNRGRQGPPHPVVPGVQPRRPQREVARGLLRAVPGQQGAGAEDEGRLRRGGAARLRLRSDGGPGRLSRAYADFLNTGKGSVFAPGPQTDGWRAPARQGRPPGRFAHPVAGLPLGPSAGGAADHGRRGPGVLLDRLPPAADDVRRGDDPGAGESAGPGRAGRRRRPTGWPSPPSPPRR